MIHDQVKVPGTLLTSLAIVTALNILFGLEKPRLDVFLRALMAILSTLLAIWMIWNLWS